MATRDRRLEHQHDSILTAPFLNPPDSFMVGAIPSSDMMDCGWISQLHLRGMWTISSCSSKWGNLKQSYSCIWMEGDVGTDKIRMCAKVKCWAARGRSRAARGACAREELECRVGMAAEQRRGRSGSGWRRKRRKKRCASPNGVLGSFVRLGSSDELVSCMRLGFYDFSSLSSLTHMSHQFFVDLEG